MPAMKEQEHFTLGMGFNEALTRFSSINTKEVNQHDTPQDKATPFVKWVGRQQST